MTQLFLEIDTEPSGHSPIDVLKDGLDLANRLNVNVKLKMYLGEDYEPFQIMIRARFDRMSSLISQLTYFKEEQSKTPKVKE
jgi:hypothetical protein